MSEKRYDEVDRRYDEAAERAREAFERAEAAARDMRVDPRELDARYDEWNTAAHEREAAFGRLIERNTANWRD